MPKNDPATALLRFVAVMVTAANVTLIVLLAFAISARAAPVAPVTLTGLVTTVDNFGGTNDQFSAVINFTFPRSVDDPGTGFSYTAFQDSGDGPVRLGNLTVFNVPDRPDWVSAEITASGPAFNAISEYTFNVSAWNVALEEGPTTCAITLEARVPLWQDQCGEFAQAPGGLSVDVQSRTFPGESGSIRVRWNASEGDVLDDYNYTIIARQQLQTGDRFFDGLLYLIINTFLTEREEELLFTGTRHLGTFDADYDANRVQTEIIAPLGLGLKYARFGVLTYDAKLHWYSMDTPCSVGVDLSVTGDADTCGNIAPPTLAQTTFEGYDVTPHFPAVNVAVVAPQLGVSEALLGAALGGLLVTAAAIAGMILTRSVLAGAASGALGLGAAATLGLWPIWSVVVVFLAAVGIIILRATATPNGGE